MQTLELNFQPKLCDFRPVCASFILRLSSYCFPSPFCIFPLAALFSVFCTKILYSRFFSWIKFGFNAFLFLSYFLTKSGNVSQWLLVLLKSFSIMRWDLFCSAVIRVCEHSASIFVECSGQKHDDCLKIWWTSFFNFESSKVKFFI